VGEVGGESRNRISLIHSYRVTDNGARDVGVPGFLIRVTLLGCWLVKGAGSVGLPEALLQIKAIATASEIRHSVKKSLPRGRTLPSRLGFFWSRCSWTNPLARFTPAGETH
jgi:hypothetical protein